MEASLGIENEHEDAHGSSAGVANVPDRPRLGHIGNTLRQAIMQQDAAGAAAKQGPDDAPALGGGCEESGQMSVLKAFRHDGLNRIDDALSWVNINDIVGNSAKGVARLCERDRIGVERSHAVR